MNCPNCNTENEQAAQFCENCGTKLQEKQSAPSPMPDVGKSVNVQPEQITRTSAPNIALPKRKKKGKLFSFIFLGFMAIVATSFIMANNYNKGAKEPSEMGRYTFDMLQNMDKMTTNDFIENFIDYWDFYRAENNVENKKAIKSLPQETYENDIESYLNEIKSDGLDYSINWKEIEYMDFVYKKNVTGMLSIQNQGHNYAFTNYYSGTLYFKESGKQYIAEVTFMPVPYSEQVIGLYSGTGYKLYDVELWERKDFEDFNKTP